MRFALISLSVHVVLTLKVSQISEMSFLRCSYLWGAHISGMLVSLECSYLWGARISGVLISLGCSYLWGARISGVLVSLECSYLWSAHISGVLISLGCSYLWGAHISGGGGGSFYPGGHSTLRHRHLCPYLRERPLLRVPKVY